MISFFKLAEFQAKGLPKDLSPEQNLCLANLRDKILTPIREAIGSPMVLTDCYRSQDKFLEMMRSKEHNPSPTSDHFWGQPIPTSRPQDVARFGKFFKYSVGAVDFQTPNADPEKVFQEILQLDHDLKINVGQVILEAGPSGRWIHISNPKNLIYSDRLIAELKLQKDRFLISTDNGLSYQRVES